MYQTNHNFTSDHLMMTNSAIIAEIGKYIKHHRLRQNKTQKELATDSGIKRETIARIENGSHFTIMTFIQLVKYLNILEEVRNMFKVPKYISPSIYMKMQKKQARRIRHSKTKQTNQRVQKNISK